VLSDNIGAGIGRCSICGQEKKITHTYFSQQLNIKKQYCEECFQHSRQKIPCPYCGEQIAREDMAKHKSDMHTD